MSLHNGQQQTTWHKAALIVCFAIICGLIGYQMSETEKTQERLKRMEVSVAVCGDVAAYFAPNDELTAGAEISVIPGKVKVAKR